MNRFLTKQAGNIEEELRQEGMSDAAQAGVAGGVIGAGVGGTLGYSYGAGKAGDKARAQVIEEIQGQVAKKYGDMMPQRDFEESRHQVKQLDEQIKQVGLEAHRLDPNDPKWEMKNGFLMKRFDQLRAERDRVAAPLDNLVDMARADLQSPTVARHTADVVGKARLRGGLPLAALGAAAGGAIVGGANYVNEKYAAPANRFLDKQANEDAFLNWRKQEFDEQERRAARKAELQGRLEEYGRKAQDVKDNAIQNLGGSIRDSRIAQNKREQEWQESMKSEQVRDSVRSDVDYHTTVKDNVIRRQQEEAAKQLRTRRIGAGAVGVGGLAAGAYGLNKWHGGQEKQANEEERSGLSPLQKGALIGGAGVSALGAGVGAIRNEDHMHLANLAEAQNDIRIDYSRNPTGDLHDQIMGAQRHPMYLRKQREAMQYGALKGGAAGIIPGALVGGAIGYGAGKLSDYQEKQASEYYGVKQNGERDLLEGGNPLIQQHDALEAAKQKARTEMTGFREEQTQRAKQQRMAGTAGMIAGGVGSALAIPYAARSKRMSRLSEPMQEAAVMGGGLAGLLGGAAVGSGIAGHHGRKSLENRAETRVAPAMSEFADTYNASAKAFADSGYVASMSRNPQNKQAFSQMREEMDKLAMYFE